MTHTGSIVIGIPDGAKRRKAQHERHKDGEHHFDFHASVSLHSLRGCSFVWEGNAE